MKEIDAETVNKLSELSQPLVRIYSDNDQQLEFSGDQGFKFADGIEKQVVLGPWKGKL